MAFQGRRHHCPLTLYCYILCLIGITLAAEQTIKKCFKGSHEEPQGSVTLTCPEGTVIAISEALLGKNIWSQCVLTDEDCTQNTKMFRPCEGNTTCHKVFRTYSARCGYSSILLVSFDCLQVTLPIRPDLVTTEPPESTSVAGGQRAGVVQEGDNDHDGGRVQHPGDSSNQGARQGDKEEDELEVGLLIATILASLVTGVMLIIAIVMTIRRLLNYPMRLQRREGESPSRFTLCIERACLHVDKLPCFSGLDSLEGHGEQSLGCGKSLGIRLSCDEEVASNSQRARMTPIGQEASDVVAQSKDDRDEDPEGSDISEHAQTLTDIEADASRSSFKIKQSEGIRGVNSYCGNKNFSDKINNWSEKTESLKTVNNNNNNNKNNNNNNIVKSSKYLENNSIIQPDESIGNNDNDHITLPSKGETPLRCGIVMEDIALEDIALGENPVRVGRSDTINGGDFSQEDLTIKPEYTAIVVPNTETSSRC